ncbi:MFS transporter [Streptomyces sp. NPDC051956]|uniref:MFS transporter n=1 Tax=Streptomyces sp. NPDC051956 TaxID=3365677 RepID=UPI0037D64DEC
MLTVARVLIGIGTSAAFPCAMVMIRRRAHDTVLDAPPGGVLSGLAIAGMAIAAVGPPIGGLLIGAAGWRWAFFINIPITVIALVMAVRWLPKDPPLDRADSSFRTVADRIDLPGIIGFAASMTALVVFLTVLDRRLMARTADRATGSSPHTLNTPANTADAAANPCKENHA